MIRFEGCGCGVQVQPRFSVHAPCDYDIVGIGPGCTSFPLCLSSTLLSLLSVSCFRNVEGIEQNELNLKCVLTERPRQPSRSYPTPSRHTEDLWCISINGDDSHWKSKLLSNFISVWRAPRNIWLTDEICYRHWILISRWLSGMNYIKIADCVFGICLVLIHCDMLLKQTNKKNLYPKPDTQWESFLFQLVLSFRGTYR